MLREDVQRDEVPDDPEDDEGEADPYFGDVAQHRDHRVVLEALAKAGEEGGVDPALVDRILVRFVLLGQAHRVLVVDISATHRVFSVRCENSLYSVLTFVGYGMVLDRAWTLKVLLSSVRYGLVRVRVRVCPQVQKKYHS